MDIKIESSCGKPTPWLEHGQFIDTALDHNKELFAKVVVTDKITSNEINDIAEFLKDREVPIILQPVMSENKDIVPKASKLLSMQESLLQKHSDVRIIPQVHKYLNLL